LEKAIWFCVEKLFDFGPCTRESIIKTNDVVLTSVMIMPTTCGSVPDLDKICDPCISSYNKKITLSG